MTAAEQASELMISPSRRGRLLSGDFSGAVSGSLGPKTNSVACQSTATYGHFGMCELLFDQPPGQVVTADHAYERRLLMQQFDHRQIDLIADERYDRMHIFVQHRDVMDFTWRVFCKTLPSMSAQQRLLIEQRDYAALRRLREQEEAAAAAAAASKREADDNELRRVVTENEASQTQITMLKKQLDMRAHMQRTSLSQQDRRTGPLGSHKAPSSRDLERFAAFLETSLQEDHLRSMEAIVELECEARASLSAQMTAARCAIDILTAERTLVVPPFQGYRPKVPTESSLQPEEYLRKCLVAEVFEHYNYAFEQAQILENTCRNAIANEAWQVRSTLWCTMFAPLFQKLAAATAAKVTTLETEKEQILTHVQELALADKLKLMQLAEADTRAAMEAVRHDDLSMIQAMSQRLETVSKLAKHNVDLLRQLEQQGQRHNRETAVLIAAIENNNKEPAAHPPMLPLESRVAYSKATQQQEATTKRTLPLVRSPPKARPPASRSATGTSGGGAGARQAARPLNSMRRPWQPTPDAMTTTTGSDDRLTRAAAEDEANRPVYFSGYL